jgi:hypothetical protein
MKNTIINADFLKIRPLSYSSLKEFAKSPKHYLHYVTQPRDEASPDMFMGSVVDCLLWTPDDFEKNYMILPKLDLRTKDGKEKYAEIMKTSANKKLVKPEDYEIAKRMKQELNDNENVMAVLNQITQPQKKLIYTDEQTGLPMIGYLDGSGDKVIAELKTTKCAEPTAFAKDAMNYDYPLQCGFYTLAEPKKQFYYILIEKEEPFGISVLKPSAEYIAYGQKKLRGLLNEFEYCMKNDLFMKTYDYRYTNGHDYLELPGWVKQ